MHKTLLCYTKVGSIELGENYHELPMILGGDFNCDFTQKSSNALKNFLRDKFSLEMNNNPNVTTTRSGTTIDAVFSIFLNNILSIVYVSYFSYHKPLISFIKYESNLNTVNCNYTTATISQIECDQKT